MKSILILSLLVLVSITKSLSGAVITYRGTGAAEGSVTYAPIPIALYTNGVRVEFSPSNTLNIFPGTGSGGNATGSFFFATSQFTVNNATNVTISSGASVSNIQHYGILDTKFNVLVGNDLYVTNESTFQSTAGFLSSVNVAGALTYQTSNNIFELIRSNATVYTASMYGVIPNTGNDMSGALQTLINNVNSWGGGRIKLDEGTYNITNYIVFPTNVGITPPRMNSLIIDGAGTWFSGGSFLEGNGTILNMSFTNASSKLFAGAFGNLELNNLIFKATNGQTCPILLHTFTTLKVKNCAVIGGIQGSNSVQVGFVSGGLSASNYVDFSTNSTAQGYGTIFEDIYVDKIKTAWIVNHSANGYVWSRGMVGHGCGGDKTFWLRTNGMSSLLNVKINHVTIEGTLTTNIFYVDGATGCDFFFNGLYDPLIPSIGYVFTNGASGNTIGYGFQDNGFTPYINITGNTYLTSVSGKTNQIPVYQRHNNTLVLPFSVPMALYYTDGSYIYPEISADRITWRWVSADGSQNREMFRSSNIGFLQTTNLAVVGMTGTGPNIHADANGLFTRTNITGGSGNLQTNSTQFAPNVILTIVDGVLLTNAALYTPTLYLGEGVVITPIILSGLESYDIGSGTIEQRFDALSVGQFYGQHSVTNLTVTNSISQNARIFISHLLDTGTDQILFSQGGPSRYDLTTTTNRFSIGDATGGDYIFHEKVDRSLTFGEAGVLNNVTNNANLIINSNLIVAGSGFGAVNLASNTSPVNTLGQLADGTFVKMANASGGGGGGFTNFVLKFRVDGGGSAITTGLKDFIYIDKPTTIMGWFMRASTSANITADIYRTNFLSGTDNTPTSAQSITTSTNKPNVTSMLSSNYTVGGWAPVTLASNDTVWINIDSATGGANWVNVWLLCTTP